jgi:hypothetical protein
MCLYRGGHLANDFTFQTGCSFECHREYGTIEWITQCHHSEQFSWFISVRQTKFSDMVQENSNSKGTQ